MIRSLSLSFVYIFLRFFFSLSLHVWYGKHLVNFAKATRKIFYLNVVMATIILASFLLLFIHRFYDVLLFLSASMNVAIVNLVLILSDIFLSCSVYILYFPEAPRKLNASHATPISVLNRWWFLSHLLLQ